MKKQKPAAFVKKKFEDKNVNDRKYIAKLEIISLYR